MYLYEIGDSETIPDRCKTPKVCPTAPNRVAFQQVNGVAIYNFKGNAVTVNNVEQGLKDALAGFVRDAQALVFGPSGLVLERLLWMGAYNCRCISKTDTLSGHALAARLTLGDGPFAAEQAPFRTPSMSGWSNRGSGILFFESEPACI